MPAAILVPALIGAVGATVNGVASYKAGSKAAQAQQAATAAAMASQDKATEAQSKSAADTLQFEKDQAARDYAAQETARRANYDQWGARESRIGSLGEALGLPARNIPAYVPLQPPQATGTGPAVTQAGGTAVPGSIGATPDAAAVPGIDPAIVDALNKNYAALGTKATGPGSGPTDIAYMAGKIKDTGGLTPANVQYWLGPQGRIAAEIQKAAGGGGAVPGSLSSAMSSSGPVAPLTPAYQAPKMALPGSIRSIAA